MAMDPTDPRREAILVFNRLTEQVESPLKGNFDVDHLKALHHRLFQDLPHLRPGETREDTSGWSKHRGIEGRPGVHEVHYAADNVEAKAAAILKNVGGPAGFASMSEDQFAKKMADAYASLDHAHLFHEGNSRTLREFTRDLAQKAGFELTWAHTDTTPQDRRRLYLARDVAVLDKAFPGLTPEIGMKSDSLAEYETSLALPGLRKAAAGGSLEQIIREGTVATPGARPEATRDYEVAITTGASTKVSSVSAQALDAIYAANKPDASTPPPAFSLAARIEEMERKRLAAATQADAPSPSSPGLATSRLSSSSPSM